MLSKEEEELYNMKKQMLEDELDRLRAEKAQ
jgi:hypothetical protein